MKINSSLLITMLALSTAALNATAQSSPTPTPLGTPMPPPDDREPPDHPPAPPWLKALDADDDGIISAEEITNSPTTLRTLDLNKDGVLTPDELHPLPPQGGKDGGRPPKRDRGPGGPAGPRGKGGPDDKKGKGHRPPPSPVIAALDTDKDGTISSIEMDKAPASLQTLDKNGDGQLTKNEIRPPRPPKPPEGENEDGPENGQPPEPPPAPEE